MEEWDTCVDMVPKVNGAVGTSAENGFQAKGVVPDFLIRLQQGEILFLHVILYMTG